MRLTGAFGKISGAAVFAAALALNPASIAPAAAQLVKNGDFTGTTLSYPGGYICSTLGSTCTSAVTDWGSACSSFGICGNGATPGSLLFRGSGGVSFNSYNGLNTTVTDPLSGNYIAIDGDPVYSAPIFQTINGLRIGGAYQLQFYQSAAQQGGFSSPTTDYWQVSLGADTQNSQSMSPPTNGTFLGWGLQTMDFTATSTSEVLNFFAIGPGGVPPVALLADVSLSAVPEPATWAMLLVGFAGLGFAAYRRGRRIPAVAEV